MQTPVKISAVIPTLNEEKQIGNCISSVRKIAAEVIIVDSGSTDNTRQICKKLNARVIDIQWKGYGNARNLGAGAASFDYIYAMDADERITPSIIEGVNSKPFFLNHIYRINRKNFIGDKWINHSGWWPDWQARIYNRRHTAFEESMVHEHLIIRDDSEVINIPGYIHHYSYDSLSEVKKRYDIYARLKAKEWIRKKTSPGFFKRLFGPAWRFFKTYFFYGGIMNGRMGFKLAVMAAGMSTKKIRYYDQLKGHSSSVEK